MSKTNPKPIIIDGYSSQRLGKSIAEHWDTNVVSIQRKQHDDSEIGLSINDNFRGRDTIVIASAAGDPNKQEKETRLLMRTAKASGAKSVTLLLPYMFYGRSDDTWDERQVAALTDTIETFRPLCDHVVVCDPHNQTMTRQLFLTGEKSPQTCEVVHFAYPFAKHLKTIFAEKAVDPSNIVLMHADAGSKKRITPNFRECVGNVLGVQTNRSQDNWPVANKDRDKETGESRMNSQSFSVENKDIVIFEDMVSSGGTAVKLAQALKDAGAQSVTLCATTGLFTAKKKKGDRTKDEPWDAAIKRINNSALDHVLITDTYNYADVSTRKMRAIRNSEKIHIIPTGTYLAEILKAMHTEPETNEFTDENSVSAILSGRHYYQKAELETLNT